MQRQAMIKNWLQELFQTSQVTLTIASNDASFRRYFRTKNNNISYIIMDAPPEHESLEPFASLTSQFRKYNLNTPKIFAENKADGFLLLSDFGDTNYLDILNEDTVEKLYTQAIDAILDLQKIKITLPEYNAKLLNSEMQLFEKWYLQQHLQINLSQKEQQKLHNIYKKLTKMALSQPQVCTHRDFHSRNLMQTPDNNLGIIDFQDAVIGGITYDLVSLLKDCYIAWDANQVLQWLNYYYQHAPNKNYNFEQLQKWFDWMGLQRHLKIAGIFARLNYRDNKPQYLDSLPQTIQYIKDMIIKYPELDFRSNNLKI